MDNVDTGAEAIRLTGEHDVFAQRDALLRMIVPASNVRLIPDPDGSIVDAETLQAAQSAYDAIVALDQRLASLAPNGSAYGDSHAGKAALRAYFAIVDAITYVGIIMDDGREVIDAPERQRSAQRSAQRIANA